MRRRGVTLVEIAFACLLASLLMGVVWNLLGGGLRQSSFNIGRTEALASAILALDTLEEDLRALALTERGDRSVFGAEGGAGGPILAFKVAHSAGDGEAAPLVRLEDVEYRLQPAERELSFVTRNRRPVGGARVSRLRFVPRAIERKNGGRLYFVQTFLTTVDSSGQHRLPLMGLTHVGIVSADQRHPYWSPNEDQTYRRGP